MRNKSIMLWFLAFYAVAAFGNEAKFYRAINLNGPVLPFSVSSAWTTRG
jgi:hypothetical protein